MTLSTAAELVLSSVYRAK